MAADKAFDPFQASAGSSVKQGVTRMTAKGLSNSNTIRNDQSSIDKRVHVFQALGLSQLVFRK